jgi:hypothetical protein
MFVHPWTLPPPTQPSGRGVSNPGPQIVSGCRIATLGQIGRTGKAITIRPATKQ